MLKSLFKVLAILFAVIYVFSFILLFSAMYASNALLYSRYHIRIDLKNNEDYILETGFYHEEEKTSAGFTKLYEEYGNPYQITFDVYDNQMDNLKFKINITNNSEMIEKNINIDVKEYGSITKLGYTIDCETGEIIETSENIDDNDIGKSMQEKLVELIVMVRNISLACFIFCVVVSFIIIK